MNPFKYGRVVGNEDFCPRPELENKLFNHIKSCQNVLLEGERRMGKTSLVFETSHKLKNYHLLYTDILEIKTSDDFCRRLLKSIISLEKKAGFTQKIFQSLSQLKPTLSFDPISGSPSLSLDAAIKLRPENIEALMDLIEFESKKKNLVVVFDEFQDILNLKDTQETLALLRSKIQFHSQIAYIFAGSIRNKMNYIFTDPTSPFFKSAVTLYVDAIDQKDFSVFIQKKFKQGERELSEELLAKIFETAEHISGDIQQICGVIWEITSEKDKIGIDIIPQALELIYSHELKAYETTLSQITSQQLKCLLALTHLEGQAPLSSHFIKFTGIRQASSISKALSRLEHLKIIYKYQSIYKFINPFFKSWLKTKNL